MFRRNVSQNGSELCHASVGALTRSCYGYNRMRYFPRLWTHSKSVPLRLTRRDGHEKPLLFFVPLTCFGEMVLCIIHAYGSKNVTDMGKTRLYYAHIRRFIAARDPLGRGSPW